MKISETTVELVNQICATAKRIAEIERDSLGEEINNNRKDSDSEHDMLRYVIFQDCVGEVLRNCALARDIYEMSDEDLDEMVKKSDMSIGEAILGAMLHTISEVIPHED